MRHPMHFHRRHQPGVVSGGSTNGIRFHKPQPFTIKVIGVRQQAKKRLPLFNVRIFDFSRVVAVADSGGVVWARPGGVRPSLVEGG